MNEVNKHGVICWGPKFVVLAKGELSWSPESGEGGSVKWEGVGVGGGGGLERWGRGGLPTPNVKLSQAERFLR